MVCRCIKDYKIDNFDFKKGVFYDYTIKKDLENQKELGLSSSMIDEFDIFNVSFYNVEKKVIEVTDFRRYKFGLYFIDQKIDKLLKDEKVVNNGPKRESINRIVDDSIIKLFNDGNSFLMVKSNLENRSTRIKNNLIRDMKTCEELKELDTDTVLYGDDLLSNIKSSRVRYSAFYIRHCEKRISDIKWMVSNRIKFSEYDRVKFFNLIKLRDKLTEGVGLQEVIKLGTGESPIWPHEKDRNYNPYNFHCF